jgi:hypothetical protein
VVAEQFDQFGDDFAFVFLASRRQGEHFWPALLHG